MISEIKAIIWDLDGTLYQINDHHSRECNIAAANVAIEMGADIGFEEACALAQHGFEKYHNGFQMFHEKFGLDIHEFQMRHNKSINLKALHPCEILPIVLPTVTNVIHAVLTHGSNHWAQRVLSKTGILDVFENHIYGMDDVNYQKKTTGPEAFQIVMDKLGVKPSETIMVEDALANLVYPKQLGMKTVYISGGRPSNDDADYVFDWTADFLQAFKDGKLG